MATTMQTAAETLQLLEERLARIEFVVNGDSQETTKSQSQASANTRLRNLERALRSLSAKSYAVCDILELHRNHPEIFHPADSSAAPSALPPASLAQLILAHENLYKTSASQLSTLNDSRSIPDPVALTSLISMQPRIQKLEAKQREQAKEFAELRARSAKVVENWYENGVLDMGDKWADWEERLKEVEILVRRQEAAKRRDEEMA